MMSVVSHKLNEYVGDSEDIFMLEWLAVMCLILAIITAKDSCELLEEIEKLENEINYSRNIKYINWKIMQFTGLFHGLNWRWLAKY